ncbi:alpha/beta hydrolase family protein [Paenibacillus ginsengarvi]|uniref:Acetyl xylan esterase domain-containing protein n=1 Tax=Paenibacillus ginsengarvi TaxID=400777 RepID=A0A3B0BB76_9BACL|nr:acetylxylan esterase [Paenibacillus ginsengarvi]RKN70635.1 hypothetical protein D7M11_29775 [Paenibacillus ginsengarvi]
MEQLEKLVLSIYDVKDQLKRHVYSRSQAAFEQGDRDRDEIRTPGQLAERTELMRRKLIETVGGLPSSDHPLQPRVTGTLQCEGYSIKNVIFESRPATPVTCNLYMPDGITGPSAAVLFMCGHADYAKQYERYQSVCQRLVAEGLIVLAMDPVGQGERYSYFEPDTGEVVIRQGTREHDYAGSQCLPLGDSLARYFIHDGIRAVDYLCSLPEVDPQRIGVTGNSGGGLQTSLMMLCEPRIAAAAPGTFIMNRESYMYAGQAQDAEQIWRGMTKWGFDHEDLVLAMAPRPVLVLAATSDFFPIEGTRRTVARTKRFWDMFGITDMPALAEDRSVHQYSARLADAAAVFFAKHLLGRQAELSLPEGVIAPHQPELLNCTSAGQVRAEYKQARAVYDENIDRLNDIENRLAAIPDEQRQREAVLWLRDRVSKPRAPFDLNSRFLTLKEQKGLQVESYLWWSQEGVFNHGLAFRETAREGQTLPVTIALWEHGTNRLQEKEEWIRETCAAGRIVLVLDVTGDGACTPHPINPVPIWDWYGTIHKLTTDLIWLDDSLAAIRSFDVIRAVDMIGQIPNSTAEDVRLYTRGRFNLYAEIAAALDDRFRSVEAVGGIESVAAWVRSRYYEDQDVVSTILPGMLSYFDLPDLRRWRGKR